jgi:hypothetical protein
MLKMTWLDVFGCLGIAALMAAFAIELVVHQKADK